ncbi:MAG: ribose-5-phosphate isomerase A, partial [Chromatiaceae bacterium]
AFMAKADAAERTVQTVQPPPEADTATAPEGKTDFEFYPLARQLIERPGVLEHGLFLGMATDVVVAGKDGVRVLQRAK